jgi:hypothetical protein
MDMFPPESFRSCNIEPRLQNVQIQVDLTCSAHVALVLQGIKMGDHWYHWELEATAQLLVGLFAFKIANFGYD